MDLILEASRAASSDGVRLRIDGADVISAGPTTSADDRFANVFLSSGDHTVELVYFEQTGAAQLELFAAQGQFTTANNAFRLVGDSANGGLSVHTTGLPPNQPPRVVDVLLSGTSWSPAVDGYSLTGGADQLNSVTPQLGPRLGRSPRRSPPTS
jgi:hypothetical protein